MIQRQEFFYSENGRAYSIHTVGTKKRFSLKQSIQICKIIKSNNFQGIRFYSISTESTEKDFVQGIRLYSISTESAETDFVHLRERFSNKYNYTV